MAWLMETLSGETTPADMLDSVPALTSEAPLWYHSYPSQPVSSALVGLAAETDPVTQCDLKTTRFLGDSTLLWCSVMHYSLHDLMAGASASACTRSYLAKRFLYISGTNRPETVFVWNLGINPRSLPKSEPTAL